MPPAALGVIRGHGPESKCAPGGGDGPVGVLGATAGNLCPALTSMWVDGVENAPVDAVDFFAVDDMRYLMQFSHGRFLACPLIARHVHCPSCDRIGCRMLSGVAGHQ